MRIAVARPRPKARLGVLLRVKAGSFPPHERSWLCQKYPRSWPEFDPIWERISECWRESDPGNDFAVHGKAIVTFCDLCQLVLSNGTPREYTANTLDYERGRYVFCSKPCRWIFEKEPERYAAHKDVVKRVLAGEAPANLIARERSRPKDCPEHHARVFERFSRFVPARHYGGFGLGLWIAQEIVRAHGGQISVQSRSGEGTNFRVVLPLAPPEGLVSSRRQPYGQHKLPESA